MMDGIDGRQTGLAAPAFLLVSFAAAGNSTAFRLSGWSAQEPDSVWTIGPRSELRIPKLALTGPAILDLDVSPCTAPQSGVLGQLLAVAVNGQSLGCVRITAPSCVRITIPAGALASGNGAAHAEDSEPHATITFTHHCFLRPDLFGPSKDNRALAIRFFGLRLYPEAMAATIDSDRPLRSGIAVLHASAQPQSSKTQPAQDPAVADETIIAGARLKDCRLGDASLGEGWHVDEDNVVWTAASFCHVDVPVPAGQGPASLSIGLAPLVIRDLLPVQRLIILADGMLLGVFRLSRETALSIAVPDGLVAAGSTSVRITLFLPEAIPMRQFARGDASHRLGMAVDWIAIQPVPERVQHAAALRGDEVVSLVPIAVSDRFVDLKPEEVHEAVQAALGVKPAEVMRSFESLGDNCAFGLAQRKAGAEILGLLRFANTSLRALLRGLADGFKAATEKSEIELYLHHEGNPREYMLQIARYGIRWHTMVHEPDADAETVGREQIVKLGFLRRKFDEGLRNGRKTYSLVRSEPRKIEVPMPGWGARDRPTAAHGPVQLMPQWDAPRAYEELPPPLCVAEAIAVLLELNRAGPNTLLFFKPCPPGKRPGTVELLAPGLMRGYMSSFVIAPQIDMPNDIDWLRVAANAWLLRRDYGAMTQLTQAA